MRLDPSTRWLTILLGVCAGLPALSIDLSAPTLAILPTELGTSISVAGLSLSLFMVGFAAGQFTGGRASDRFGRRPVLLVAILIYTLVGVCCIFATTGGQLATARLAQGVGAGACSVQAAAIVQDFFLGETARRKQASVSIVLTIMPMLAPAFGSILMMQWSWHAPYVAMVASGLMLGIVVLVFLGESHPVHARSERPGLGIEDSLLLLRDPSFRRLVLVNALSYGTIFAYIAGAPIIVMGQLGCPPLIYAALFALTAAALTLGTTFSAVLGKRGVSSERLIWPGLVAQATSTLAIGLAGRQLSMQAALFVVPALLVCCFARGVIVPNLVYLAVSNHRDQAGLASALVGLMQLLLGAAASAVVAALLPLFGFTGVAGPMCVLSCSAALIWGLQLRREDDRNLISR